MERSSTHPSVANDGWTIRRTAVPPQRLHTLESPSFVTYVGPATYGSTSGFGISNIGRLPQSLGFVRCSGDEPTGGRMAPYPLEGSCGTGMGVGDAARRRGGRLDNRC